MPIIAVNLRRIEAINSEKKADNINVNSAPSITKVRKHEKLLGMENIVALDYTFETKYDPDVGKIIIEGDVLYSSDKANEIVKTWETSKKLDDDMAVEVLNAIFRRGLGKAIELSGELRLPPPMRFPNVVKEEKKE